MKHLGDVIAGFRKLKGVESKIMADHVGISASYLSSIETNSRHPSPELLTKIANYLNVPVSALIYEVLKGEGFKNAENQEIFESAQPIIDRLIHIMITDKSKATTNAVEKKNKVQDLLLSI